MTQQKSQTSLSKLLKALSKEVWEQDGLTGEAITPTLADIQEMAIAIPELEKNLHVISSVNSCKVITTELMEYADIIASNPNPILDIDLTHPDGQARRGHRYKVNFPLISRHIIRTAGEPSEKRLKHLHDLWKEICKENDDPKHIEHPLMEVVRAWIQTQLVTKVTSEYDRRHPVAVLKHPLGNVRELAFIDNEVGQVFQTPERAEQVKQLQMDLGSEPSILPATMPLEVVRTERLKAQTKSGAVSHELRIFFEAMMALEPKETQKDLMFRLGHLIDFLYPNGKFNWTNQMPHIKRALGVLHLYATVPWIDDTGSLREWRPVVVRAPLMDDATRDTPIYIDVKMPPDAKRGHMILKGIHRRIGMKSAPQWNAYHVACYLWDKYGTVKGKLVDPTRPIETRDAENRLVAVNGTPLVNKNGKEIKSPYHPEAIRQLDREPNPDAINRHPVLSFEDLILACFPNGYPANNRRKYLQRAKAHWQQLEDDGILIIHKKRNGWRILPSDEHLNAHRALRKASKGVY